MAVQSLPLFPNYTQLPTRVPLGVWYAARGVTVTGMVVFAVLLVARPDIGLPLFWGLLVPVLPIVWLTAPGLWRNVCPLAAVNQAPRVFGFTRGATAPAWWGKYAYAIGFALFVALVSMRPWLFNTSGVATAILLMAVLSAALVGGWLLKGKSGWCSSVCPLLPVQRLYGQTPFAMVPNSHCQPCVGCTRNCYDFNPGVAQFADLNDDDPEYVGFRRLFAGIFPGVVAAFFTLPVEAPITEVYGRFALFSLVSLGLYWATDTLTRISVALLTALWGAAAINLFYWYTVPRALDALETLTGAAAPGWVAWPARWAVLGVTILWLVRTWRREQAYEAQTSPLRAARVGGTDVLRRHVADAAGKPEVTFEPSGRRVVVDEPRPLLDVAEQFELPIEPGCRMGVCGADPVAVLAGMQNLSEVGPDERGTLDRLGYAANTRMACMARVLGAVTVSLEPEEGEPGELEGTPGTYDETVQSVVILGNGIAGVTAADHVRRRHPDCDIHLVGREMHHLYNRMAISRLIYGRSAMHGLYLQPDEWYERKRVTCWLNTQASRIDRERRVVALATGEELAYDRLVVATGGYSWVPPMEGFGLAGTFVLREAQDAAGIRAYAQEHGASRAVVAGGGLLGIEAAHALHRLGLHVTVLEMAPRLLVRQVDERASELLRDYLERVGLQTITGEGAARVTGQGRLEAVHLTGGRELAADLLLVAAGVRCNTELATAAGLEVDRGIVVDNELRTSDPAIYAAGDVAQHGDIVYGLWPPAVEQARIAGVNAVAVGEHRQGYDGTPVVAMLKGVGMDLLSLGRVEVGDEDEQIVLDDPDAERYAKLVVDAEGRVVGAILLGCPELNADVSAALKEARDVRGLLDPLRAGDWSVLTPAGV